MKKAIAILLAVCLAAAVLSACGIRQKIKINADEKILSRFSDCMKPEEILYEVSDVDLSLEMDTTGLIAKKETDDENDTAIIKYFDKNGDLIYEEYEGYGEDGFDYYTKSKSGDNLEVHYSYGYYDLPSSRDVHIKADNYSASFYVTDPEKPYGADSVYLSVDGESKGMLQESITYQYDYNEWTAYAWYFADDGMHNYERYYDGTTKEFEEYDTILFEKVDDVKVTDLSSIAEYFGGNVYQLEMKISSVPFYSEKDGKMKWYYGGPLSFVFASEEDANDFSKQFDGEVNCMGDDVDGYYYVVEIKNTGLPIADGAEFFDPYDYADINDWYSVVPNFNEKMEITSFSGGTISYY